MLKSLHNWTAQDVVKFLRKYGFQNTHIRGSHHYYSCRYEGKDRQVSVPFHGKKTIKARTLNSIMSQSGISKHKWLNE